MPEATDTPYEVWIDVGGTFTDCYVRFPAGQLARTKLLSSCRVLVSLGQGSQGRIVVAPELAGDPDGFWEGAKLRFREPSGTSPRTVQVVGFRSGRLELDQPLSAGVATSGAAGIGGAGGAELDAGLEAPVLAVRRLLGIAARAPLPQLRVRLGTTKGTNALLTRSGAKTALAITAPLEDLLLIGDQTRPDLFALAIQRPPPLAEVVVGIRERLAADGSVLQALDREQARRGLEHAKQAGCTSLAICLMHAYVEPRHELRLQELAREVGFAHVSRSSELAPLIEIVPRAQTAVVDAYLSPIVREYLQRLVTQLGGPSQVQMWVMTSGGGLVAWHEYFGKDSILSGPAGGVAALRHLAQQQAPLNSQGRPLELIGLDMGGTSTDVCRVSGEHGLQYESTKAGVRIFTPTLPIETVASGGGSVCWFDGVSLRVGPHSAGASPGPACYGQGGPLTITDLNVYLNRIPAEQFPFPIDFPAVEDRLGQLLQETHHVLGFDHPAELARGFRRIANEQMAAAVRTVSIAQGVDPRSQTLVGFGGAAGQHICEIAALLGVTRVIDSPEAGLLSALGMGHAPQRLDSVVGVYQLLPEVDWTALDAAATAVEEQLQQGLIQQGVRADEVQAAWWLEMRYAKTEATLVLPWLPGSLHSLPQQFSAEHRKRYGYARSGQSPLEVVAVRIEVASKAVAANDRVGAALPAGAPAEAPTAPRVDALAHYPRQALRLGQQVVGPAVVLNYGSTLVIDAGWRGTCQADGSLILEAMGSAESLQTEAIKTEAIKAEAIQPNAICGQAAEFDPVFRDCFAQRLSAIATQMGIVLQHTAVSVNVKQRRDYSCAVFDAAGRLLANAPHVPVHLGAMGETVRAVLQAFPNPRPGDSFVTNDPYRGGSHLPDITVIMPVFDSDGEGAELQFFVANRAHHADIGGVAPGSMSIAARRLGDEGVVIAPMQLTANGEDLSAELRSLLERAPYPPRSIPENMADIAAQLAACARGAALLSEYATAAGWQTLGRYAAHVLDAAEDRVRNYLQSQPVASSQFLDYLDDGTPIQVRIASDPRGQLSIDFQGSGPINAGNFNANRSIVTAAVMYVLRCLMADELPLNEGVMRCVDLVIPPGVLNPPGALTADDSPAVAAGNVETSQRVVDVLLGAWGVAAASQGTMNNLLFGNSRFGFYETICGGAGATAGQAGASGVHTHMTNTRLTDPEVLEARYPVRLQQFGLRHGSGGRGRWPGGEGVVRRLEFLEPVQLSLLTSRRGPYAPFGLAGGQAASLGYNTLLKADGSRVALAACCQLSLQAGDQLEILTPGGGGFGSPLPPE